MEEDSSSFISSSSQEAIEDYNWVTDKNFLSENKKDFLKYPLNNWKEIAFDPNLSKSLIYSQGDLYESRVQKVLKNDVFKDFIYLESKYGKIDFDLYKYYHVAPNELLKEYIVPDFFVHKIEVAKFNEFLENRKYMIRTFQKIDSKKKYISIIGEIKLNHSKAFKNNDQRKDYITFIQKAKSPEEELALMYVYDESYKLFKEDKPKKTDKIFLILCYIPKLYFEDCYKAYNKIIENLNSDEKKIDMTKKPKKIITKKELKNQLEEMNKLFKNYIDKRDKREKAELFGIFIFVLIIAFLLYKKKLILF